MSLKSVVTVAVMTVLVLAGSVSSVVANNCSALPPRTPVTLDSLHTFQYASFGGSDCWGWQGPDGTEYAIMGVSDGVAFVNVTTLQKIQTVPGPTSGCSSIRWRDMETYDHYLYCVSECGGTNQGMMIIDMQFLPDSVHFVGSYVTGSDVRSHNMFIDTAMGYAYVVKDANNGFRVISLADRENPVEFPSVNTQDIHDVYARNDTVWVSEGNRGSWSVWDMSNKNGAQLIVRVPVPNSGYLHNVWPSNDGDWVVTTEETANKTMKVWDVSNGYSNISRISDFIAPSNLAHNAHVFQDYVITSHYESGVHVADLSTPSCPEQVAQFDTYPPAESPNFNGCWGAFPYTNTGKIYASNGNGRLFILQSDISLVAFNATPRVGEAPLAAAFTDITPGSPTAWVWDFGDGDSAFVQAPSHTYTQGGLYDVTLSATTAGGASTKSKSNFITVLADTMGAVDISHEPGISTVWEIYATNAVPVTEFVLPVILTNVPSVAYFDSISFVGTRADYFESQQVVFDDGLAGRIAVKCVADNGGGSPALAPGTGLIARVHIRTRALATVGATSQMSVGPLGSQTFTATTLTTDYTPIFNNATLTIAEPPCECFEHGDVVDDGVLDAIDLSAFIDFVYFEGIQPPRDPICPHIDRGDFNCDGIDNTVDLALFIDAVFFGGPGACDPCACNSYPDNCP